MLKEKEAYLRNFLSIQTKFCQIMHRIETTLESANLWIQQLLKFKYSMQKTHFERKIILEK